MRHFETNETLLDALGAPSPFLRSYSHFVSHGSTGRAQGIFHYVGMVGHVFLCVKMWKVVAPAYGFPPTGTFT